jgi:predicted metalloprotease with PDZ domain
MAQQLARFWIGGKLRVATTPGHDAEAWWFSEGVSRYLATVTLAHLGLLSPDEVNEAVGGELSVLATSPFKALGNVELGQQWRDPVARATVMARGALYALRESAAIRAHTKGQRSLVNVLGDLERQVEDHPEKGAIPLAAWLDAVGKDDPDAAKTFDAVIVKGQAPALPGNALGPCFRAGAGEYVAFDPGFDFDATRVSPDGKVVGVRPGGPAAKAGLQNGDVVESMTANEDDADVPVKIVLTRAGGSAKVNVTYVPRGVHGRGQTFTRNRQLPDDRCGELD